jgi:hypothetical protein
MLTTILLAVSDSVGNSMFKVEVCEVKQINAKSWDAPCQQVRQQQADALSCRDNGFTVEHALVRA